MILKSKRPNHSLLSKNIFRSNVSCQTKKLLGVKLVTFQVKHPVYLARGFLWSSFRGRPIINHMLMWNIQNIKNRVIAFFHVTYDFYTYRFVINKNRKNKLLTHFLTLIYYNILVSIIYYQVNTNSAAASTRKSYI